MRFLKNRILKAVLVVYALAFMGAAVGCGVKGDPLPPEKPAEIGRGRPTYKRAIEEIKIQKTPGRRSAPAKNEADEDDDEKE